MDFSVIATFGLKLAQFILGWTNDAFEANIIGYVLKLFFGVDETV